MCVTLLPAFLAFCFSAGKNPPVETDQPKLPLGKDTTYVTGPLDKLGFIDYEGALNLAMSRGVTPENNANVLLLQVFGPAPEGGNGFPPAYYRWLDVPMPPKEGEYFVGVGAFVRARLALNDAQLDAVFNQLSWAGQRPWSPKAYPVIAEWLKLNADTIALAVEATKRPEYFNPLVTSRKGTEPTTLISALLPSVQRCRELASALVVRAMLRLEEGKFDEAWQDLLACHRLARHVSRGATLIEGLVGIAISQIASNATVAYLEKAGLTSKQATERLKELRGLPPLASLADKIDVGERFVGLESLQNVRRVGFGFLAGLTDGQTVKATPEELKALAELDWIPAMQALNKGYNRLSAAMRLNDRASREKEFDRIDEDLKKLKPVAGTPEDLRKLLLQKRETDKNVSQAIGETILLFLSPAVRRVQTAYDRAEQVQRNLHVAFAMAAYHADHKRYPAELAELSPKYLAEVPGDCFSGKPLIYKRSEKGYLVYSVGQNGKDDGGRWVDDDPPGDDLSVRMPLPPLKKK